MKNSHPILPRHIAIVMDGNGRWAKQRNLPRVAGHRAGQEAVRKIIEVCVKKKLEVLTLFAFSSENWRRPSHEVDYLMELFSTLLEQESKQLHQNNIQVRIIGDVSKFNKKLLEKIRAIQALTQNNTGLVLVIAADYGGRWDIIQAVQKIADEVYQEKIMPVDITQKFFSSYLCCYDLPEPDLFIRTSGERRISNFLIWQLAYTELFFTDTLWPDFNEDNLEEALKFYISRQRRFGHTSEQLEMV